MGGRGVIWDVFMVRPLLRLTVQVEGGLVLGRFLLRWVSEVRDSPLLLFLLLRVFVMSSCVWGILRVACFGYGVSREVVTVQFWGFI